MASIDTRSMDGRIYVRDHKVRKIAKIRNRYLTQDTNGKATTLHITKESQEVSPIPAGDHKAPINIPLMEISCLNLYESPSEYLLKHF